MNQKEALEELQESYVKQTVEIGHFVGLNLDLKKLAECKYIKFRFGRIPKECYEKLSKYEDNPYVLFFQCTSDATTIGAFISLLWNTFSTWTTFLWSLFRTSAPGRRWNPPRKKCSRSFKRNLGTEAADRRPAKTN